MSDPHSPNDDDGTMDWGGDDSSDPGTETLAASDGGGGPPSSSRRVGRFELARCLGGGPLGEVYLATHVKLQKPVVLRLLPDELLADGETVAGFLQQVRLWSGLSHPHVARCENAGQAGGRHYLVVQYVHGLTLDELVQQTGPLPAAEACQLIQQAAWGLQAAHQAGLIHHDVKLSNLMLSTGGEVKLLDFALALLAKKKAGNADARADIYALGCALFKLMAKQPPFALEQFQMVSGALLAQKLASPPPAGLPDVLERLVTHDDDAAYATAGEAAAALAPFTQGADAGRLLKNVKLPPGPAETMLSDASAAVSNPAALAQDRPAQAGKHSLRLLWLLLGLLTLAAICGGLYWAMQ